MYIRLQHENQKMNSQQSHSEIANENLTSINPEPTPKYIAYNDIKKYQSEIIHRKTHNACNQSSFKWNKQTALAPNILTPIRKITPIQYLIQHPINQCCLNKKISINFSLKRYNILQITKVKQQKFPYQHLQQYDIKYSVIHAVSVLKIQLSIRKQKICKIWKEIEIPIKSYETEVINSLSVCQNINGDIYFVVNQFQFMMNLNFAGVEGLMFLIKCDGDVKEIQLYETNNVQKEVEGGCREGNCSIF